MTSEFIWAGIVSAIAILFLLLKLDIQKVCGYDVFVDIFATGLLMLIFSGTYSGMMAAIIGGAIISVTLWLTKTTIGFKRLRYTSDKHFHWRYYSR